MSEPSTEALSNGYFFQRLNSGFDEKAHETQFDTVLFFKLILEPFTQLDHRSHIGLVESGENGIVGLRLQQPLGDAGAQTTHGNALLCTLTQIQWENAGHWSRHGVAATSSGGKGRSRGRR